MRTNLEFMHKIGAPGFGPMILSVLMPRVAFLGGPLGSLYGYDALKSIGGNGLGY